MTSDKLSCKKLTRYEPASFAELWSIAYPIMLTALSGNLMIFMDKLLLCRYAPAAMAAVTTVGMVFTVFQFASISIASIAEVFVGKYNGGGQYGEIGPIVWQMIWFSVFTVVIFFPIGYWYGQYLLLPTYYKYGIPYFKMIMYFGPVFSIVAALSAFFIGQGKVRIITISTIAVNIINVVFAYLFIFGYGEYISPMGSLGAALGSGIAISLQGLFLFALFLNRKNRIQFKTTHCYFNSKKFWYCLKVGVPNSMGYLIEMAAWACLLQLMMSTDEAHIMVLAFGQAIFLLVAFTTDGLQKAVITIASNMIGMKNLKLLPNLIRSSLKLHGLMVVCAIVPLILFPNKLMSLFFTTDFNYAYSDTLLIYARITCMWVLIYFIFDGLVWVSAGILTAFEDTVFIMTMNAMTVWLFAILPNYVAIQCFNTSPSIIWKLMSIYALLNSIGFFLRYLKKISVVTSKNQLVGAIIKNSAS